MRRNSRCRPADKQSLDPPRPETPAPEGAPGYPPAPAPRDRGPAPSRIDQLRWLGIDATTLQRLTPYLIILPSATTAVNANNAPKQVLVAAVDDLKLEDARQLVRNRPLSGLDDLALGRLLPPHLKRDESRIGVRSRFFEVRGTLRLDDRVLEDRWLVEARPGGSGMEVVPLRRERRSLHEATP